MISKIRDEIEEELPTDLKNACQSLFSESEWPSNIKPCLDFNKGFCEKTIFHDENIIHTCDICKLMFRTPFFHRAKSCKMLRKLDSGTITAKSASQCVPLRVTLKNNALESQSSRQGIYQ